MLPGVCSSMLKVSAALAALLLIAGCGHKALVPANVAVTPAIAGPPEHEVLYKEGVAAFRLATAEGYQRAGDAFRKASTLNASNCDYAMRLAEAWRPKPLLTK